MYMCIVNTQKMEGGREVLVASSRAQESREDRREGAVACSAATGDGRMSTRVVLRVLWEGGIQRWRASGGGGESGCSDSLACWMLLL